MKPSTITKFINYGAKGAVATLLYEGGKVAYISANEICSTNYNCLYALYAFGFVAALTGITVVYRFIKK